MATQFQITNTKRLLHKIAPYILLLSTFGLLAAIAQSTGLLVETGNDAIAKMIEAHGGLEKWRSAPTVSFEDHFRLATAPAAAVSRVTVQQNSRRAYLDFPGTNAYVAWDGEKAWSENLEAPFPPRFIALLNYYFLNLPWLTQDPGVILNETGTARLWEDPTEYVTVKMAFETGIGDTPEDYYVLYIDPKSYRLKACEYIVTYAAILPEGVATSPPHILVFEEFVSVDGLVVPTRYSTFEKDHTRYANCEIRNWSFEKVFDETRMQMTPGAVIDTSNPQRVN